LASGSEARDVALRRGATLPDYLHQVPLLLRAQLYLFDQASQQPLLVPHRRRLRLPHLLDVSAQVFCAHELRFTQQPSMLECTGRPQPARHRFEKLHSRCLEMRSSAAAGVDAAHRVCDWLWETA